jgi:chloramphenicol 3-O-phosphotransferase
VTGPDGDQLELHRQTIRSLSRPGGPLAPDGPTSTKQNLAWFSAGDIQRPRPARVRLWRALLDGARAEHPAALPDRRAIVLAGPPGAGKSTVLAETLGDRAPDWLLVDADEFKVRLLRQALADGSYETFLKPGAVRDLERRGEAFFPLELAPLVHEESAVLARMLRDQAIAGGVNLVIDSVLWNTDAAIQLGEDLDAADYTVEVIDVEVPYQVSQDRIAARWRRAQLADDGGLGGRWVPSDYARGVFDPATGRARSQVAAERLAETCPAVVRFRRFWTPSQGVERVLEIERARVQPGAALRR